MVWLPADRLLIDGLVATPLLRLTWLPNWVPSTKKATSPVGVPLPEFGVTVAVKLMLWPTTDGFAEEVTVVVVGVTVLTGLTVPLTLTSCSAAPGLVLVMLPLIVPTPAEALMRARMVVVETVPLMGERESDVW